MRPLRVGVHPIRVREITPASFYESHIEDQGSRQITRGFGYSGVPRAAEPEGAELTCRAMVWE